MLKKIILALTLCGFVTAVQAQKSLSDLVSGAGVEWLAGQWQAESDNGDAIQISFKSELDNNIALLDYKDARTTSKGIVVVDTTSGEPKYYGGDNKGGFGTGVWSAENNKAILKYKSTASDGKVTKMGFEFSKVDDQTMQLKVFELVEKDALGDDAKLVLKFKRKK